MVLAGTASLALLAMLVKRELGELQRANAVEETKISTVSEGLQRLRGPSASIDFRHIRSLSKKFLTRIEPPSPIDEYPDPNTLLDPFAMKASSNMNNTRRTACASRALGSLRNKYVLFGFVT